MSAATVLPPATTAKPRRPRGYWGDVWYRFRRQKLPLLALGFVWFLILIAVTAPLIVGTKPWMLKYQGVYYYPGLKAYFGDDTLDPIFTTGRGSKKLVTDVFREERFRKADPDCQFWWPLIYQDPSGRVKSEQFPGVAGNQQAEPPYGWQFGDLETMKMRFSEADREFLPANKLLPQPDGSLAPIDPTAESKTLTRPRNLFGTTINGNDVFAAMVYGTSRSLLIGFVSMGIASAIGIVFGSMAGYFGGWIDTILSRIIEIVMCIPSLILVIAVVAVVEKPQLWHVMVIIGCTSWTSIARLTRGEFLKLRETEYTNAARALGAGHLRIIFRHILPNSLAPILVPITFGIASAILLESSLAFLGIGVVSETSWGNLLNKARTDLSHWWLIVFPGGAIFLSVMAYNFIGEGLQEATDPRLRNR